MPSCDALQRGENKGTLATLELDAVVSTKY